MGGRVCVAAATIFLMGVFGCSFEKTAEYTDGVYFLKSASLINQGKISELTCSGEFFIVLKKGADSLRVQPVGSASCPAANPGSFVEVLGGDCEQAVIELSRSFDESHYSHSGADWSCASRSSAHLEMGLDALTDNSVRVIRRNLRDSSLVSEFIFVRTTDVL